MDRVYVTRRIPEAGLKLLSEKGDVKVWDGELPVPRETLLKEVREASGLICLLSDRIDAEVMDSAKHLKVIANYAVGYDNIDIAAAEKRGIVVTNTPGVLTETTAELAVALMFAISRRIVEASEYARAGLWKTWGPRLMLGRDLYGSTLGIFGLGRIGAAVGRRGAALGMKVIYYSRTQKKEMESEYGFEYVLLEKLLAESDFLTLHSPLTNETASLIGARELEMMKETAYLINTARGGMVDHDALYAALKDGQIAGAALDVTEPEPLAADHPLYKLKNCIITPHIGSASIATRARMAEMVAQNVLAVLSGKNPLHPVTASLFMQEI